jgi:hypothetical protein
LSLHVPLMGGDYYMPAALDPFEVVEAAIGERRAA